MQREAIAVVVGIERDVETMQPLDLVPRRTELVANVTQLVSNLALGLPQFPPRRNQPATIAGEVAPAVKRHRSSSE
jgi:hypothetical protein